jgi:hypothetical protein
LSDTTFSSTLDIGSVLYNTTKADSTMLTSPQQYYVIIQSFDILEFIFRLYKTKMIDAELWSRWEATAKSMMTIPKFKRVWDKTKDSRSHEFRELVDSFPPDL